MIEPYEVNVVHDEGHDVEFTKRGFMDVKITSVEIDRNDEKKNVFNVTLQAKPKPQMVDINFIPTNEE